LHKHVQEVHQESFLDIQKILKFHELMLKDEVFHNSVCSHISKDLKNAEWAVMEEAEGMISRLENSGDPYFRARVEDVWDMVHNILLALSLGFSEYAAEIQRINNEHILVSKNLFISEVMKVKHFKVRGLVTESRALTSHAAILLRSFNIPSIGMVENLTADVENGDRIILDGIKGQLIITPTKETSSIYFSLQHQVRTRKKPGKYQAAETRTKDGTRVSLLGNIDNYQQIDLVNKNMLEGIGLFCTEFLIFETFSILGEEQQYQVYKKIIESMEGKRVVMRTFDIGADKRLPYLERCVGQNPALGVRGIRRHILRCTEELRTQLLALLRAAAGSSIDILFPMVTTIDDVIRAKEHVVRVKEELSSQHPLFSYNARLGVMLEIVSAAIAVEKILSEVDFISVGTNDLIQYFTATDRDNEAVYSYGDIHNESVIFLLKYIIEKAMKMHRVEDVTICGEVASEPEDIPLLLRMGYRSFSISPVMAQPIRDAVGATKLPS